MIKNIVEEKYFYFFEWYYSTDGRPALLIVESSNFTSLQSSLSLYLKKIQKHKATKKNAYIFK